MPTKGKVNVTGKVVDIESGKPFDVYIGNPGPFGLPMGITRGNPSAKTIHKRYEKWVRSQPMLMGLIPGLRGKVLGGWGEPEESHGQVLLRIAEECASDDDQG